MLEFSKLIKFIEIILRENWWQRIRNFLFLIGEGAFDLGINLIIMVMVERSLGTAGLGVFAYLLSILIFAGFISDFGISRYLEREISFSSENSAKIQAIEKALYAVIVTSIFCAVLFFITALSDSDYTRVDEKAIAYIIIGITIPIRNLNRIRIAIIQGSGKFDVAAKLKSWKRIFLFGATYFLLICRLPASVLVAGFLISELGMLFKSRKILKLPSIKTICRKKNQISSTLAQSSHFLLTDETLDVVLHLDFFLLGFFVSSMALGMYAEASILVRIFLIIPISIKPVFRKKYCSLIAANQIQASAHIFKRATAFLFFLHSVLALYILLYYPLVMNALYHSKGVNLVSFHIFAEILPGLLFFSIVTSQEPVYEAEGKIAFLQNNIIIIAIINIILNSFFIPFAGYYGAAFATSASMFCYFILFGRHMSSAFKIQKYGYIIAGAALYLTYILFKKLALSFEVSFFLVPAFLFLLLVFINFFNFKTGFISLEADTILSENIHKKEA